MEAQRAPGWAGASRVRASVLVAVAGLLVACGPGVPEANDPLVSASTRPPPLPENVGPADCDPASPVAALGEGSSEIRGAAAEGTSLWAKVISARPFPSGRDLQVLWRIPGSSGLRLVAVGPGGERVSATAVAPTTAPSWDRPGDAWVSTLRFTTPGCWRINATRGRVHGDVWLVVSPPQP